MKIIDWSKHIKYEPNSPSVIEEKSAWSEEDEKMREKLLFLMEEENSIESWEGCYEWLKLLKT